MSARVRPTPFESATHSGTTARRSVSTTSQVSLSLGRHTNYFATRCRVCSRISREAQWDRS
jgi:hypothetical protein